MTTEHKVEIRRVKPSEIRKLRDLACTTFVEAFGSANKPSDMALYISKAFTMESITLEYNCAESEFYFVTDDDKTIGYLKLNFGSAQSEDTLKNSMEIERIYVKNGYQGRSIGEKMINKSIAIAKERFKDIIWLGVWEENRQAIKFYERHGFISFAKHNFMLGQDEQTDILMKRSIS